MKHFKIVLSSIFSMFLVVVFTSQNVFAQTERKAGDDLGTEQVNVVQDYKPTIVDAVKLNDNPQVNDSTPLDPKLTYKLLNKRFENNFELEPISAAKMKGEPLTKLYKSYVKVGLGTYTTPYAEAFISNLRSKEFLVGAHGKHLSSTYKTKEKVSAGFSDNELGVFGKYFFKESTLTGALDYNRNGMHYYGVDRSISDSIIDKAGSKQAYTTVGFNAKLASAENDTDKLFYNGAISFYNFSENGPATENNFLLDATLSKYVKTELFGANVLVDYYSNKNSLSSFNEALVTIAPFVKAAQAKWQAILGIKVTVESSSGKTHFLPNLHANYQLVENMLAVYLDIEGKTERNSYKKLATENPFILSSLPIQNSTVPISATLGFRGNISSEISFHLAGNYTSKKDMPLYVNYALDMEQSRFTLLFDNANIFNAHGELAYTKSEKFRLGAKVDYFHYLMENEARAWHRPSLEVSINGKYNLQNKIWITADVFGISKQYAKISSLEGLTPIFYQPVISTSERELKGIADINLGVEYLYNKRLSAFVKFNNIAAYRYYRWNNYPNQRFNLMAGLTYSF